MSACKTSSTQAAEETLTLEQFVGACPDECASWTWEKSESPDFVVSDGERKFGFELVEVSSDPVDEKGSVGREAHARHEKWLRDVRRQAAGAGVEVDGLSVCVRGRPEYFKYIGSRGDVGGAGNSGVRRPVRDPESDRLRDLVGEKMVQWLKGVSAGFEPITEHIDPNDGGPGTVVERRVSSCWLRRRSWWNCLEKEYDTFESDWECMQEFLNKNAASSQGKEFWATFYCGTHNVEAVAYHSDSCCWRLHPEVGCFARRENAIKRVQSAICGKSDKLLQYRAKHPDLKEFRLLVHSDRRQTYGKLDAEDIGIVRYDFCGFDRVYFFDKMYSAISLATGTRKGEQKGNV